MRKVSHPYVGIRCPHTNETLLVREYESDDGWVWQYRGRQYDNLDDVLDARAKKFDKVTVND